MDHVEGKGCLISQAVNNAGDEDTAGIDLRMIPGLWRGTPPTLLWAEKRYTGDKLVRFRYPSSSRTALSRRTHTSSSATVKKL